MDKLLQFWLLTAVFSLVVNALCFVVFFFCGVLIKKMFWNVRTFFMRNSGFGYALIMFPEGRLEPIFTKLGTKISIKFGTDVERSYIQDKKTVFSFWGLPAYIYNLNDNRPVDIRDKDDSHELERHSEMLDNLCVNIKAQAEAKAFKKFQMIYTFVIICLLAIVIVGAISGFSAVKINDMMKIVVEQAKIIPTTPVG